MGKIRSSLSLAIHALPYPAGNLLQAIDGLRNRNDGWWAVALSPLITQAREFHILHRLKSFPVSPCSALPELPPSLQALRLRPP